MTRSTLNRIAVTTVLAANLIVASGVQSGNRLSQLVFPFPSKRSFTQSFNPATNTLTLEIAGTHPHELSSLDYYDDKLIRRVLVRDLGAAGSEVNITLKDKSVTATVMSYDEPFRIIIDIFDRHYEIKNDPITGLPLAHQQFDPAATADESTEITIGDSGQHTHREHAQNNVDRPSSESTQPRHRLMQPTPQVLHSPDDLRANLSKLEPGVGSFWSQYPIYIYRVQNAPYHDNNERAAWYKNHADKAMSSSEAMADYASKLFDFGHENRALVAYQQVLYKDPSIFDKDAVALWKFAETHFGQGNLTLADGYYQAMIVKHPNHDLSYFARIRRLDIEAIRASEQGQNTELQKLAASLADTRLPQNSEIQAQATIRKAFWTGLATSNQTNLNDTSYLPPLDGPIQNELRNLLPEVESQKTSFIASSILLNSMLSSNDPWSKTTGQLSAEYLSRFSGKAAEPYRSILSQKVMTKVKAAIAEYSQNQRDLDVLRVYEELPASLKTIKDDPMTAWHIGEAYRRHLNQIEASIPFYRQAASSFGKGPFQFKANFWLALMAGKARQTLRQSMRNPSQASYYGQISRSADEAMDASWNQLQSEEKDQLLLGMKKDLADSLSDDVLLATPARVLLEALTSSLSTRLNATEANPTTIATAFTPSATTVRLLSTMAERFDQLRQSENRRKTLELLRHIKPAEMANDSAAKKLWAKELLTLADDYRSDNLYFEAGQTYAFTGSNADGFEQRAESLYKGGLLLYRAGRSEEAINAFQQCSEDGNNRYYANLCTERLDRLNNQ